MYRFVHFVLMSKGLIFLPVIAAESSLVLLNCLCTMLIIDTGVLICLHLCSIMKLHASYQISLVNAFVNSVFQVMRCLCVQIC
ncbi:hypothetical protein BC833DRAFT_600965, partial [Globomyces pollinis-pini]